MSFRLTQLDDIAEARELHRLAFPGDHWAGDDHTYWVLRAGTVTAGFCSAKHHPDYGVFLSRAAVCAEFHGYGLQRRMIQARVAWARRERAALAYTYTSLKNYPSIVNLLRCGFAFIPKPALAWVGPNYHYFQKVL